MIFHPPLITRPYSVAKSPCGPCPARIRSPCSTRPMISMISIPLGLEARWTWGFSSVIKLLWNTFAILIVYTGIVRLCNIEIVCEVILIVFYIDFPMIPMVSDSRQIFLLLAVAVSVYALGGPAKMWDFRRRAAG